MTRTSSLVRQAYGLGALLIFVGLATVLSGDSHGVYVVAAGISLGILGHSLERALR